MLLLTYIVGIFLMIFVIKNITVKLEFSLNQVVCVSIIWPFTLALILYMIAWGLFMKALKWAFL